MTNQSIATDIAHQRAQWAWKKITATDPKTKYKELIKSVPALINQSGLLAAMAFLKTRTGSNKEAANQAYSHLQDWLIATDQSSNGKLHKSDDFLAQLAAADTRQHRQRTEECMAILSWLRRFADVAHGDAS